MNFDKLSLAVTITLGVASLAAAEFTNYHWITHLCMVLGFAGLVWLANGSMRSLVPLDEAVSSIAKITYAADIVADEFKFDCSANWRQQYHYHQIRMYNQAGKIRIFGCKVPGKARSEIKETDLKVLEISVDFRSLERNHSIIFADLCVFKRDLQAVTRECREALKQIIK